MCRFDASYWRGIDLLAGGLPCPPFSIAGKRLGADDDRNMFPAMLRIVEQTQPRGILIENVRGILTSPFASLRAEVDGQLDDLGFDSYWTAFNAVEFGVPQMRFRVFLVALRRGHTKPLRWPIPTLRASSTVGETLVDLMASRGWKGAEAWAEKANAPAPTIVRRGMRPMKRSVYSAVILLQTRYLRRGRSLRPIFMRCAVVSLG